MTDDSSKPCFNMKFMDTEDNEEKEPVKQKKEKKDKKDSVDDEEFKIRLRGKSKVI